MPAVSDASPLILFAKIRRLNLLMQLFSEIIIPIQVRDEVIKHGDESSSLIIWLSGISRDSQPSLNQYITICILNGHSSIVRTMRELSRLTTHHVH